MKLENLSYFINTIPIKEDNKKLYSIAKLLFESHKEFYTIFNLSEDLITKNIKDSMYDERSEFFLTQSWFKDDDLVAILVCYPVSEGTIRQTFSNRIFASNPTQKSLLSAHARRLPPIDSDPSGFYLTRIAIVERFRKNGLGKEIMGVFENQASSRKMNSVFLHVTQGNVVAKQFYERLGYESCMANDYYSIMAKKILK